MEEWKSKLIAATVNSEIFPSETKQRDIDVLTHLAERSDRQYRHERKAESLEETFDLGTKGTEFVRRLVKKLGRYYGTAEGQRQVYHIEIVRGPGTDPADRYAVRFVPNPKGLAQLFWKPHLDKRFPTFITYGVPLFFKTHDQVLFVRHVDRNVPPSEAQLEALNGVISRPFVAHGDLLAVVACQRWLLDQTVDVRFASFHAEDGLTALSRATSDEAAVIVLGSTRVNGLLSYYQQLELRDAPRTYLPFRLERYNVIRVDDRENQVGPSHEELPGHKTMSVPVVITRRLGAMKNSVTMIGSNHGRAVFGAARALTNEEEIVSLFKDARLQRWLDGMPANFQILARVEVLAEEEMAGKLTVEDVWPSE